MTRRAPFSEANFLIANEASIDVVIIKAMFNIGKTVPDCGFVCVSCSKVTFIQRVT
jgi:hypothetical protein